MTNKPNLHGALKDVERALEKANSHIKNWPEGEQALAKLQAIFGAVPEGLGESLFIMKDGVADEHAYEYLFADGVIIEAAALLQTITEDKDE